MREDPGDAADARVQAAIGTVPNGRFDHAKLEQAVRLFLEALGEDPDREGLRDTPRRVARAADEIFGGLLVDPEDLLTVSFGEDHDELVMVRDIAFYSTCEHHLVPFHGEAHVAYLPDNEGRVTGLSKIARLVDACARRPGLQERLTTMVADCLENALGPRGVLVVVEARHLCMEMRGVRKPGAVTVTSAVRGLLRDDARTRAEAMSLLRG